MSFAEEPIVTLDFTLKALREMQTTLGKDFLVTRYK